MNRIGSPSLRAVLVGASALVAAALPAAGQATIDDPDASAAQLATRLDGPGITISNPSIPTANGSDTAQQYGLFSNGIAGASLEIDRGIVLATGTVADALGPNNDDNASLGSTITYIDPDVGGIDTFARYNAAIVTFDLTLDSFARGFEINYQFGSEEYPDYVGSRFNDVFAFFVSGPGIAGTENIAQAPLGGNVRINTINIGSVGCFDDATAQDLSQSAFYRNNGHVTALPGACQTGNALPGPFPVVTEYNGITTRLTARRTGLTPGATYQVKFAVADVADQQWDSGVFIEFVSAVYDVDHADAPASYGAPTHEISSTLRLGAGVTGETSGYDDPAAAGDSDDGVTIPLLTTGGDSTIPVSVSGSGGFLQAWIDWNGDGDFADAGEQVAADVTDGGAGDLDGAVNGTIALDVDTPAGASIGQTISRFRWSTTSGLNATAAAPDGEVEDYQLTVQADPLAGAAPFVCDSLLWQLARRDTQLISISLSGSTATFTDVGSPAGGERNAGWGYNEVDGLAYGLVGTIMWAVDGSGTFYDLGAVGGLGSFSGTNSGDILPDGTMLFKAGGSTLGRIDLTRTPYTLDATVTLSGPASGANYIDFAYNPADGRVYSIDASAGRLFHFDPVTGVTAYFGPATHAGTYGAQWFDQDGNYFAFDNDTNQVLAFDVGTNGSGTGTSTVLATSSVDEGGRNDGFSCRGPSPLGSAQLAANKTIALFDGAGGGDVYALPGADVIYMITVDNTGTGSTDTDSVVLIDQMPAQVEFFNGDIDTGGADTYPGSDPVGFVNNGSGLSFDYATDAGFSNAPGPPADFAACNYTPLPGYDPNVTYICFNPKGQMQAGDPDPQFSLAFRARIR